jgi:hypothetical protein
VGVSCVVRGGHSTGPPASGGKPAGNGYINAGNGNARAAKVDGYGQWIHEMACRAGNALHVAEIELARQKLILHPRSEVWSGVRDSKPCNQLGGWPVIENKNIASMAMIPHTRRPQEKRYS